MFPFPSEYTVMQQIEDLHNTSFVHLQQSVLLQPFAVTLAMRTYCPT